MPDFVLPYGGQFSKSFLTAHLEQHSRIQMLPESRRMIKLPLSFVYCTCRIAFTLDPPAENIILLFLIKHQSHATFIISGRFIRKAAHHAAADLQSHAFLYFLMYRLLIRQRLRAVGNDVGKSMVSPQQELRQAVKDSQLEVIGIESIVHLNSVYAEDVEVRLERQRTVALAQIRWYVHNRYQLSRNVA